MESLEREPRLLKELADLRQHLAESEQRLAELRLEHQRLEHREALYRQLVENSQGLICKHDLAGNLLYVSPASAFELGYAPGDGVNRNLQDFLAPQVRPLFNGYLERIRQQQTDEGVLRLVEKNGRERLWAYRNVLHRDPDGHPYVVGHAVDITERVRAEEMLKESEARHRAVINALEEGVLFMTAEGSVIGCNPSAERILGVPAGELHRSAEGGFPREALRDDGSQFPPSEFPAMITLRTGQPRSGVIMGIRRPDGDLVWISVNARPLSRPGEPMPHGVVLSFADVTERRRLEAERERDLREALASVKVLGGILSICASCKKIRDHTSAWWPLEVYIRDHSEAEFSHGLCPDCAAESRRALRERAE